MILNLTHFLIDLRGGYGRHFVAAVVLVVLWTSETIVPMYVGRTRRVSHIATNLGLALINGVIASGFGFAMLSVTEWAHARSFGLLNQTGIQGLGQWIGAILLFDCWQYWWHRFNHRVPFLWRFHAVHHSDAEMDASSGVRFHTIEMIFSFMVRLGVLPLLGLTMSQLLLYEAISLPVILFHHSNLRISSGVDRCLRWLLVTPWMHYVHHSRWQPETDSNYTSFLSIWDRLFGSFRLSKNPAEISLGLNDFEEQEWRPLWGLLLSPFKHTRTRAAIDQAQSGQDTDGMPINAKEIPRLKPHNFS